MGVGPYLAVARQSARRQSRYRGAAVAGIFTNTVFGMILASVLVAVYRERPDAGGLDAAQALTITFVGQGMLIVVAAFGWRELSDRVRTGEVAVDLQRPVDQSAYWLAMFCGASAFAAVVRGIPPFVVGLGVFDLALPNHLWSWLLFVATVAGAALVASRWWFLVNLVSFWLVGDVRGVVQLAVSIQMVSSGALIPLQLMPPTLATILRHTPFASMVQLPAEVLLERQSAGGVVAAQLAWFLVLEGLVRLVWRRATRKLVIDGG